MAPKVVLLDMMGTVVHEVFVHQVPAFFNMSLEALLEVKTPDIWVEFEKGRAEQSDYLDNFFTDGRTFDQAKFLEHIRASYQFIDGMEGLLERLHKEVPVHILSNYPIWYRWIEERLRVSRFCEWSFVSCHTGVRKPDPEAYLGPARTLGLEPGECVFVDDRPHNCEAARSVGMPAIVFQTAGQLEEELASLGLFRAT